MPSPQDAGHFATMAFARDVAAPRTVLWQAWTAPAARAIWAAPSPAVTVRFLEADTRIGGREVSVCQVDGQPDITCEAGWLDLVPEQRSVNHEVIAAGGPPLSAALVTALFAGDDTRSRIEVTVQLSSHADETEQGYRQGFEASLSNLAALAARTMLIRRVIPAPRRSLWQAWMNAQTLPQWWGPDGFSCRTIRIDLRMGGEWVFDMIGPDGTVFPNHHRYAEVRPEERIAYALHWGEDGPKHADAWASLEEADGATIVTLAMAFSTQAEFEAAKGFGAAALGQQTLAKLERFALRA